MSSLTLNRITESFTYGDHQVHLETGGLARQANGAVKVTMGDTVLLATVCASREADPSRDFFPLTVNFQEKIYATGRIPGGYLRREGRPAEREVLISRLIDRPLRPLFDKAFKHDVQIVITVLSYDPKVQPDVPAMIGASAAVVLAGLPFAGPIAAARVGYSEGEYVLNLSEEDAKASDLDLVVAGTADAVLMVESEAKALSEEVMLGAVMHGHQQMQVAIQAINALAKQVGGGPFSWNKPASDDALLEAITLQSEAKLKEAYAIADKMARQDAVRLVHAEVEAALCGENPEKAMVNKVHNLVHDVEARILRDAILDEGKRVDGRDLSTVRPIDIQLGVLPRAHGSAVFTRGETQAMVTTTLGTESNAQMIDDLMGNRRDPFMLHYNFPPFSVGETGRMGSPKRRELGHGRLARRAVESVLPTLETFPYVLRTVSEILESNGSSSMATVCGTSLSMMDAGVPITAPVAGIAMGLVKEGDRHAVLTDILGDEDHLGDMDFKVAGTEEGITALQMDIKITGINETIMRDALEQAKAGRLHILGLMVDAIQGPREAISDFAPKIITIKINPDKIRDVIGKGGVMIREITEKTNTTIDLTDDGEVKIAAVNAEDGAAAKKWVEDLTAEAVIDQIYDGKVAKIMEYGAFVDILPGKAGLVHISQICEERVERVEDHLKEGQAVKVKVIEIDRQGRVRLTMKGVDQ